MRKYIITAIFCVVFLVSCQQNQVVQTKKENKQEVVSQEIANENIVRKEFYIEGMSCQVGCATRIGKALKKVNGIKIANVDFSSKTATVEYDKTQLDEVKIKTIIENVGNGKTFKVVQR